MSIHLKIIITVAAILLAITFMFVNNAGTRGWPRGERNIIRNVIARRDGTLRKFTKIGVLVWFALFLVIMWMFA